MARVELSPDEMADVLEDRFIIESLKFARATDVEEYKTRARTCSMLLDAYIDLGGIDEMYN